MTNTSSRAYSTTHHVLNVDFQPEIETNGQIASELVFLQEALKVSLPMSSILQDKLNWKTG